MYHYYHSLLLVVVVVVVSLSSALFIELRVARPTFQTGILKTNRARSVSRLWEG